MLTRLFVIFVLFICVPSSLQYRLDLKLYETECGEDGDCMGLPSNCDDDKCGCDSALVYNETTNECNIKENIMRALVEKYNPEDDTIEHEGVLAKTVRKEATRIFSGIKIAAIIFITCAGVCVTTACTYCCKMSVSDHTLKKDVSEFAKKVGREQKYRKIETKTKMDPIAENCPVMIEEAGVFIV